MEKLGETKSRKSRLKIQTVWTKLHATTKADLSRVTKKVKAQIMGFSDAYNKAKSISNAEAYGIDLTRKGAYGTCKANASRLLRNANLLARYGKVGGFKIVNKC